MTGSLLPSGCCLPQRLKRHFYRRVGASCYLYVLITDSATSRLDMR